MGGPRGYPKPLPRRHYTQLPADIERRRRGIGTHPGRFSVVQCPRIVKFADSPRPTQRCKGFIIARSRQRSGECPICGYRSWLAGLVPIYSHRSLAVVKAIIAGLRGSRQGTFFLPTGKFAKWEKAAERRDLDRRSLKVMQKGRTAQGWKLPRKMEDEYVKRILRSWD